MHNDRAQLSKTGAGIDGCRPVSECLPDGKCMMLTSTTLVDDFANLLTLRCSNRSGGCLTREVHLAAEAFQRVFRVVGQVFLRALLGAGGARNG